ncbi:MAG TPA: DUF2306 domain-containing protein [Silvibacterium sp.]|nr:DUF2306 domain-containing protein [Silvibacterium sp.]
MQMHANFGKPTAHLTKGQQSPLWLRMGFWVCIVIAVAVVFRRMFALAYPPRSAPPQLAALDAVFASHAALTLAHIIPALAFVVVAPFVVFRRPANAAWPERLIFPLGAVVGLTAYAMSSHSVGGWIERSAVLFFNSLFLFSLFWAYRYMRLGEELLKRRWLLRAIAILLGIATTRPVMGIFFATSALTGLTPSQFFGVAFWIGFSINTVVIELWLRSRDRQPQAERMAMHPGQ